MKKVQPTTINPSKRTIPLELIDIEAIEKNLPKKQQRSHHVVIKIKHMSKTFGKDLAQSTVLKDIHLNLYSGEFVIISGPSGSGKSTLLHSILGLEAPTSGSVTVRKVNLYKDLTDSERTSFRREKIGVVFQQSNWIKSLNVLDNVSYPLWLAGVRENAARSRALESLASIGLDEWAMHAPSELSGGQQQRVALARALVSDPGIIIADEPTGNLDSEASAEMMSLLARLNREQSRMIVMVTHNLSLLPIASRRIVIKDGSVVYDKHD
ncbi:ABC transporter ATP-binding protein [Candidatus Woesebacteria bacterium]|nr:ABC transporter ATP-binding protein [Candidatus Woesebacteria bacterium]